MDKPMQTTEREAILAALYRWIKQRPGLDFANYGDLSSYRAEMRKITRQRHDAERLLAVAAMSNLSAEQLRESLSSSDRLTWNGSELTYTTGQYWPVEYRAAACRALASALWTYWRDGMTEPTREKILHNARLDLGRSITKRWF
jgi:hypothetical protein